MRAIRRGRHNVQAMKVMGDGKAAGKLRQLKAAIAGLTGQDRAQQPGAAAGAE